MEGIEKNEELIVVFCHSNLFTLFLKFKENTHYLMKNLIWFIITTIIFTSCANESNTNTTGESQAEGEVVSPSEPGHYKASPDAPLIGLWVIEFALGGPNIKKEELANEYQGRWVNLKGDNTFESGKWQEQNNTGNWNYDPGTRIIQINYDKPETIGHEWRIQGHGDANVWLGNTPNNKLGTQLKVNKETTLPQKQ